MYIHDIIRVPFSTLVYNVYTLKGVQSHTSVRTCFACVAAEDFASLKTATPLL